MTNLDEAIKFIKDKLNSNETWNMTASHTDDLEHLLDLLLKAKQDFRNIQHNSYRIERGDE